ncbi:NADP-dependent phosphogluconate dehydrogenase [Anaerotignum sp. MB30-C6]|uniref:NADP-dependent phosphogluconate dehydrogenase n=1 Tax=Anaerotignum sp. MB30-C6 TaxID=3070814 RepID=UPI0027DBE116|nr:NADP-dependent phosphogluconate dehydrogenase [Anaerotignum sp. MB30-C6]WMI80255.1 NADP-dependent phosphogluconate dehydrogenase [Anaerotignum sp. MB30-C6]
MMNFEIAVYGLGVMGSSLAKNLISKGFRTALFGKSQAERERFETQGDYTVFSTEEEMVKSLKSPRVIFMMVTAGSVVDHVIESLLPILEKGDILIDGGNSHFKDTQRRCNALLEKGIHFLGVGVSGGEKGALIGPSMMVGGSKEAWNFCGHILEKMAAKVDDEYCCNYLGKEGAGHYVKMVHNGIEYAMIQLIADTYSVMKRGLHLTHQEITEIFTRWKNTELNGYLIDITPEVLGKNDADGQPLIEKILDVAQQKGTGSWTLEEAIARGVYVPTICESVFARYFSVDRQLRQEGSQILKAATKAMTLENYEEKLKDALYLSMIVSYAQGIALMKKASDDYGWEIDLPLAVSLWREGCIIRSGLLKDITKALKESDKNILFSKSFGDLGKYQQALREVSAATVEAGVAVPTMISVISYYDYCRTEKMNVDIVQGLRDCFGAHTYERIDMAGSFHTDWVEGEE